VRVADGPGHRPGRQAEHGSALDDRDGKGAAANGPLLGSNVLEDAGDTLRLTQDYTFNSSSTAAGVLLGRSANGRIDWKDARGRTLKEIQEAARPRCEDGKGTACAYSGH